MTGTHGDDLRSRGSRQAIPFRRGPAIGVACALLAAPLLLAGCGGKKPELSPSAFPARPEAALEIRLSFDGAADLDLHVTDPLLETVYFGNTPSTHGGRLDRDVRCERSAEGDDRRETVRFDAPLEGVYRVGVDYVKACRRFGRQADYRIRVVGPGLELEHEGRIEPGRFENEALVFEWTPDGAGPGAARGE